MQEMDELYISEYIQSYKQLKECGSYLWFGYICIIDSGIVVLVTTSYTSLKLKSY